VFSVLFYGEIKMCVFLLFRRTFTLPFVVFLHLFVFYLGAPTDGRTGGRK